MANAVDKEQIEMLKGLWNDYGNAITWIIVIGLLATLGWRYWHYYKVNQSTHASIIYQQIQMRSSLDLNFAIQLETTLQKNYSHTPYASLGAFFLAKAYVAQNKLPEALAQLKWIIANDKNKINKQVARLRVARILLAQNKLNDALIILKTVDQPTYDPMISNLKGDIYHAMKDNQKADSMYQTAKQGFGALQITPPTLDMKLAQ